MNRRIRPLCTDKKGKALGNAATKVFREKMNIELNWASQQVIHPHNIDSIMVDVSIM